MPFRIRKDADRWVIIKPTENNKVIRGRYKTKAAAEAVKRNYERYSRTVYKEKI